MKCVSLLFYYLYTKENKKPQSDQLDYFGSEGKKFIQQSLSSMG